MKKKKSLETENNHYEYVESILHELVKMGLAKKVWNKEYNEWGWYLTDEGMKTYKSKNKKEILVKKLKLLGGKK